MCFFFDDAESNECYSSHYGGLQTTCIGTTLGENWRVSFSLSSCHTTEPKLSATFDIADSNIHIKLEGNELDFPAGIFELFVRLLPASVNGSFKISVDLQIPILPVINIYQTTVTGPSCTPNCGVSVMPVNSCWRLVFYILFVLMYFLMV